MKNAFGNDVIRNSGHMKIATMIWIIL